jgi:hypothetical protein
VAVGSIASSSGSSPLAEAWNGTAWKLMNVPVGKALGSVLGFSIDTPWSRPRVIVLPKGN